MGYGKSHPDRQWWFDLEEVDGVIQLPSKANGGEDWE